MNSAQYMAKDDYSEWMKRNKMVCVTMYASDTDLFTEDEIDEMVNSLEYYTEMIDVPVPADLLFQWYRDVVPNATKDGFWTWLNEESTADDADGLYGWLCAHNYYWKRLDK